MDTSGLLCLCNERQPFHEQSLAALNGSSRRVTHSYVLVEFVAVAIARRVPRNVALRFEREIRESGGVAVVWVDDELHHRGMRLLERRLDKDWSLCDAVSFVLMSEMQIREALTTDHHFEQAGFVRLLKST